MIAAYILGQPLPALSSEDVVTTLLSSDSAVVVSSGAKVEVDSVSSVKTACANCKSAASAAFFVLKI